MLSLAGGQDVELSVLGPLTCRGPLGSIPLGGPKERAVLTRLLLHPGRAVFTDELIEGLWPRGGPLRAERTLQSYLSRWRARLSPVELRRVGNAYLLAIRESQVDACCFRQEIASAGQIASDPEEAVGLVDAALRRWRGAPYAELEDWPEARSTIEALHELHATAQEERAELLLQLQRHNAVIAELQEMVHAAPLRERRWALLMLALARSGRQAEALQTYQRARRELVEQLGLEPGPELVDLERRIIAQDRTILGPGPRHASARTGPLTGGTEAADPAAGGTVPEEMASGQDGRLPALGPRFFGREPELRELQAALTGNDRVVTVVGAGGIGKTRLAAEVARQLSSRFPDGTWFVPLAPLVDGEAVPYTAAAALGVTAAAGEAILHRLASAMAGRRVLLILDNCEHVAAGAAEVAEALVGSCPDVVVLATSRRLLGVHGERVFPLGPMPIADSADIFMDRARLAGAVIHTDDAGPISHICERLDGLPLAIELAAARARTASPAELLSGLDDQMRTLALRGPRTGRDERHLTMRQAIDWSFGLVSDPGRLLFARLSVFAGSFDLTAVGRVVEGGNVDLAEALDVLVDHSLVTVERRGSVTRYRLLEPLRQFASGCLGNADELADLRLRHMQYFTELVTDLEAAMEGPGFARWMQDTDDALADVRSAHQHALTIGDLGRAFELATRPWFYWFERLDGEQLEWQKRTEAKMIEADHHLLPNLRAHLAGSVGAFVSDRNGVELASYALERLGPGPDRWVALFFALLYCAGSGDMPAAVQWADVMFDETDAGRSGGYWPAFACHNRALVTWNSDKVAAATWANRSMVLARAAGNESLIPYILSNGFTARSVAEAIEQCELTIKMGEAGGLIQSRGVGLYMRAEYLSRLPDRPDREVFGAMGEALEFLTRAGSRLQLMMIIEYAARAFAHRGDPETAARIFGAQQEHDLLPAQALADGRRHQRARDAIVASLGPSHHEHEAAGRSLDLHGLVELLRGRLVDTLARLSGAPD